MYVVFSQLISTVFSVFFGLIGDIGLVLDLLYAIFSQYIVMALLFLRTEGGISSHSSKRIS